MFSNGEKDRRIESLESLVDKLRFEIKELKRMPRKYIVKNNGETFNITADEVYRGNDGATFWLNNKEVAFFSGRSSYNVENELNTT